MASYDNTRLVKQMVTYLRHRGLDSMKNDGFALLSELAEVLRLEPDDLLEVVNLPGKQRFQTFEDGSRVWIRATHGHTLKHVTVTGGGLYKDLTQPLPTLVHAVSSDAIPAILLRGLQRNNRPHILFSDSDSQGAIAARFPASFASLVYVDMAKAMHAGIVFSRAPDGAIVSAGFSASLQEKRATGAVGVIPSEFILRVGRLPSPPTSDDERPSAASRKARMKNKKLDSTGRPPQASPSLGASPAPQPAQSQQLNEATPTSQLQLQQLAQLQHVQQGLQVQAHMQQLSSAAQQQQQQYWMNAQMHHLRNEQCQIGQRIEQLQVQLRESEATAEPGSEPNSQLLAMQQTLQMQSMMNMQAYQNLQNMQTQQTMQKVQLLAPASQQYPQNARNMGSMPRHAHQTSSANYQQEQQQNLQHLHSMQSMRLQAQQQNPASNQHQHGWQQQSYGEARPSPSPWQGSQASSRWQESQPLPETSWQSITCSGSSASADAEAASAALKAKEAVRTFADDLAFKELAAKAHQQLEEADAAAPDRRQDVDVDAKAKHLLTSMCKGEVMEKEDILSMASNASTTWSPNASTKERSILETMMERRL